MRLIISITVGILFCVCIIQTFVIMDNKVSFVTVYTKDNIYYFYPAENKVKTESGFELKFKNNKELNDYSERLTAESSGLN